MIIESGAGLGSGLADHDYLRAGAELVGSGQDVFERADLIIKVKEPLKKEWPHIRNGQTLFTYFHFAADRELTEAMIQSGANCFAYETLRDANGRLPLLTPMSEVAGRMSIQEGAKFLERPQMGRGILLAGVPGVAPAHITILGAVWSEPMPPKSRRDLVRAFRFWMSTWIGCVISTIPCQPTSTCCLAIDT